MTKTEPTSTDMARKPQPVTPELRARVAELHAEGLGRNAIAREVTVSTATVTKIAREHVDPVTGEPAPLSFDREATAIALSARLLDLDTIREQLARKFLVAADESLDLIDAPVLVGAFGGADNTWNETMLDGPTVEQRSTLVRTAQGAAKSGLELLKIDAETGSVSARGIVRELKDVLERGLAQIEAEGGGVDPTVTPDQPAGT